MLKYWVEREELGKKAEAYITQRLKKFDMEPERVGVEWKLSRSEHYNLVKLGTDNYPELNSVRHFPDLEVNNILLQVKAAKDAINYPTVTMEIASYNACRFLHEQSRMVLMVWVFGGGGIWANWVENVKITPPKTQKNGTGTPFWLAFKSSLVPFERFLNYLN